MLKCLAGIDKYTDSFCKQRASSLTRHCPNRVWPVTGIFYKSTCLAEVSVTEQILWKFQIPRNPEGTEHAQTCTRLSFLCPCTRAWVQGYWLNRPAPKTLMQAETRIQSLNLWTKQIVTLLEHPIQVYRMSNHSSSI